MTWYSAGTISVNNNSDIVQGTAAHFKDGILPGSGIIIDGVIYGVKSIEDDNYLTLMKPYEGVTATGLEYQAFPTESRANEMLAGVVELIDSFGPLRNISDNFGDAIGEYAEEITQAHDDVLLKHSEVLAARSATIVARDAAQASATAAAGSESSVSASAAAATAASGSASTSATNASSSATTASNQASAAQTSATNAAASATAAAGSATAAATQATNASNSATAASTSATSASTSATTATTKASEASASATAAAGSASSASSSATTAGNRATAASNSADAAAASATAAANSATAAQTARLAAEAAAESVSGAAAEAERAEDAADAADASKTAAATSATNAANSATAASGSASTASTKATEASTSATNAANSASAAAASALAASDADQAAIDAQAAADAADASKTAAAGSASAAAGSATTAGTYLSSVQANADAANTSKNAAAASATAAAGSATTASTKAGEASTYASNAATSANDASASATAASTSATNAATSATNAAASASSASGAAAAAVAAQNSATAAGNSATAAAGSASAASGFATAADTSESNASDSATSALASKNAAAASATAAAGSASTAQAAQLATVAARDQTLAAFDSFDDRYVGAFAEDPTLDNDGNGLVAGTIYFNTTAGEMRVYTGTIWVAAYVSGNTFLPLTGGTLTGALTLPGDPSNTLHAATKQYVDDAVNSIEAVVIENISIEDLSDLAGNDGITPGRFYKLSGTYNGIAFGITTSTFHHLISSDDAGYGTNNVPTKWAQAGAESAVQISHNEMRAENYWRSLAIDPTSISYTDQEYSRGWSISAPYGTADRVLFQVGGDTDEAAAIEFGNTPYVGTNKIFHEGNLSKTSLALDNVDNTSDANKPISTAAQAALNLKLDKTGGTTTGAIVGPNGSATAAAFATRAAGNGMYSSAANTLDLTAGGTRVLSLVRGEAGATNYIKLVNWAGGGPDILAEGPEADINLYVTAKGDAAVVLSNGNAESLSVYSDVSSATQMRLWNFNGYSEWHSWTSNAVAQDHYIITSGSGNPTVGSTIAFQGQNNSTNSYYTYGGFGPRANVTGSQSYIFFESSNSNSNPRLAVYSGETNASLEIAAKGTGVVNVTSPLQVNGSTVATVAPRVYSVASSNAFILNANYDLIDVTALATSMSGSTTSGSPVNGQKLTMRIVDNGTSRIIGSTSLMVPVGVTMPTATVPGKVLYIGLIYNTPKSRWDIVSVAQEA